VVAVLGVEGRRSGSSERRDDALRLAGSLSKHEGEAVKLFLWVTRSVREGPLEGPAGLLQRRGDTLGAARHAVLIGVCGGCVDARGITEAELAEGAKREALEQLADWTEWAEKALVF